MEPQESSDFVKNFVAKQALFNETIAKLEQGKSIAISSSLIGKSLLEEFAEASSKNKIVYVVIEHPGAFELCRLPDGSNRTIFYREHMRSVAVQCGHADATEITKAILDCLDDYKADLTRALKYDQNAEKLRADNIVSKSFLSRRLVALAMFKKMPQGAIAALEEGLTNLVETGKLEEVSRATAEASYGTYAELYRIV